MAEVKPMKDTALHEWSERHESSSLVTMYGDFHIHIGSTSRNQPVKMSASRSLTFEAIAKEAAERKGLQLIGIIDAHAPGVQDDIASLLDRGEMEELADGGIAYKGTTLLLGTELEIREEGYGMAHVLCFLPSFSAMRHFSAWLSPYVTNMSLSSQRVYVSGRTLQEQTAAHGGIFIPAHVFTPYKSVYGNCTDRMSDVLDMELIDAVELGLSADTDMAGCISELDRYTLLTNSDAHSLSKIAREYNALTLAAPTFKEWALALRRQNGRGIQANYGLNPRLGKYHRTSCVKCGQVIADKAMEAKLACASCGSTRFVQGVWDRIQHIGDREQSLVPAHRPPYIMQVPLEFIPGVGPKTMAKLLERFGTEMAILHQATAAELEQTVGGKTAELIVKARSGQLALQSGGGGTYGKVIDA
ncbi:endonuclease Q family protein [Paenibacillus profundus]|uniref:Endonuclease Q family protein n=1 Tax=Paenibacillus profundus TaxID=1173085 RepID=A0ABS8YH27_9BACL|nr:endonuclease Q family protein [Paenibacillus profundus]MCE5169665.1 endonuclease Q family protein [Paenibacillus profundus]